ncbi:MAG: DUF3857 and transglutaminase domain-containing protein [Betaproteobacteria bacterium]
MKPIAKIAVVVAAVFLVPAFPVIAQAANDVVIEKTSKVVDLNADGTFSQTNEVLVRLISEQGAKNAGQVPLPYSESLQTLDVVEAYSLKPDGTRLDVAADKIFTQAAPVAVSAPMFNDLKYKIIVFPEPLPGGKLYFRVDIKQKTPFFPNQFSHYELIPARFAIEAFSFRLSAPAGFPIRTDAREATGGKLADKDGRSRWEWTYAQANGRNAEPFELAGSDIGPYIAISSFADWGDLAKAYRERAADKIAVTPEIQALADEITQGMTSPQAQIEAIYHWVARNVRYVGVFLGLGGFVPRESAEILKTKYGDCKDHTVILESLLRAKGIEAAPVLINTAASFRLPSVPVTGAFNHAITYVPAIDMYLDGTASFNRFGVLPGADAGKPVLQIGSGKLAATPVVRATDDTAHSRVEMILKSDGSIAGRSFIFTAGERESGFRRQIASVPAGGKEKFVTRWLGDAQKGDGVYLSTDPNHLEKPFTFSVNYQIKDAVTLQSPGAFPVPRGFTYAAMQQAISTGDLNSPLRKTPYRCSSGTLSEEISLQLPEDIKVLALPKDVSHQDKTLSFEASYRQDGRKILINRKLVRNRAREYCDPSMWEETVRVRGIVARDARAQVLIQ